MSKDEINNKDPKLRWEKPIITKFSLSDSASGGTKKFTDTENPGGDYQPQVNPS